MEQCKESACQCRGCKRWRFDTWIGKIPWSRKWQFTPVFLPGKSHRQRSLAGYSSWGCKESDTSERERALMPTHACMHVHTHTHTHTHTHSIWEQSYPNLGKFSTILFTLVSMLLSTVWFYAIQSQQRFSCCLVNLLMILKLLSHTFLKSKM